MRNIAFSQFPVGINLTSTNVLSNGKLQLRALTNSNERAHQIVFFATEKKVKRLGSAVGTIEESFVFGGMQVLCFAGLQKVSGLLRLRLN